ncbi:MAG: cytochrome b/b6 domain-containing protein, partial [Bdellovibrionaceae bacterium]|nr:cytochrome b/b6 domain-containing protein [Pseudobdellovibrionaceae bacterium]
LKNFKDAILVTLHDLGLKKNLPKQSKFNGAQKIAYSSVLLMGILQIMTGLSIYKPVQFQSLTSLFGGYEGARLVHFIVTVLLSLFFLVHIFQVIKSGWNNFRSMVTGYEKVDGSEVQKAQGIKSENC